jgi:MerR family copper efflux transcriptional regulator
MDLSLLLITNVIYNRSVRVQDGLKSTDDEGWSIGEVAAVFGLKTSTLRFWEDQGLLHPSGRRSGRRVYDRGDLRRIALITIWRDTGLMELREILAVLDGGAGNGSWRKTVRSRLEAIDRRRERLNVARGYLAYLLTCPSDHPAATCPHLAHQFDHQVERALTGLDERRRG